MGQDIFITKENNLTHYNKLTSKRKAFINQLYNLINTQFEEQKKLEKLEPAKIIEELENNSDYIQRIFIDAPWGMGKSFFSKALQEKVEEERITRIEFGKKEINFININAWETDYFSDPMKSLIGEINNSSCELTDDAKEKAEKLLSRGFQALKKIGLNRGLSFIMEAGLDRVLCKIGFDEAKRKEFIDIFNETEEINTNELEEYKKYKELVTSFKISLSKDEKLKVIVIDELDRCKPTYAIELLETVKHFFGVKNIIFIFLVNKEQLKSIASTSYLTEDKCSEYFEKFFDIQFNLPKLEYEDFIQIEYDDYNQTGIYGANEQNTSNEKLISDDTVRIYESIFLEAFNSNCDSSIVSPRNFIKSFKKFKILLSSLSNEERACYPLMTVLIVYFIREEFLKKIKTTNENVENIENKLELDVILFKTFFLTENNEKINFIPQKLLGDERYSCNSYKIKGRYEEDKNFYLILANILYLKNSTSGNMLIREKIDEIFQPHFSVLDKIVKFENLKYKLHISLNSFENPEGYIYIDSNFFTTQTILNHCIENCYNTNILEAWAEEKYNFTMNIK